MSAFDDDLDDGVDDAFDPAFDAIEDENNGDATVETEGEVHCPWCGEPNTVALDPGSGSSQEYVEDCQVCCRPWVVHVTYDVDGRAEVWAEAQGDWDD